MSHVAVLGMGLLGSGFAEGLLTRGGTTVTVWNRTRARAEAMTAFGATVADTPADAVRGASRVHLVLLDDDTVDAVIAELRPGLAPDAVIVDHTTTQPARTAARAAALAAEGIAYLHAPVMMGPPAARKAMGMMLLAGPQSLVDRVRDGLTAMTGELWYVGERPDLAAAYKLVGNGMLLGMVGLAADVMHMMDAANVPRAGALEMISKINFNGGMGLRGTMMRDREFHTNFALTVARKDLRLMTETANDAPMPMLHALAAHMDAALELGLGAEDFAILGR